VPDYHDTLSHPHYLVRGPIVGSVINDDNLFPPLTHLLMQYFLQRSTDGPYFIEYRDNDQKGF
jgi:hypothetical protein